MDDDDPLLTVHQRTVAAGSKVEVPAGAMVSPFAMARTYLGDRFDVGAPLPPAPPPPTAAPTPAPSPAPAPAPTTTHEVEQMDTSIGSSAAKPASGPRGPHLATRARESLKACGPLTVAQLAEALGVDQAKAEEVAAKGVKDKRWKRTDIEGETKLVLSIVKSPKAKGADAGLKRHLAKKAVRAESNSPPTKRGRPSTRKVAPVKAVRAAIASKTELVAPAPAPFPRLPLATPRGKFGLFNTGELHIEFEGKELKLPKDVARELVNYLDTLSEAFG